MKRESRERLLIEAIHAAAVELAKDTDSARYPPPVITPNPTSEEIHAFGVRGPVSPCDADDEDLWCVAISAHAIFERVRLAITNVTLDEIEEIIMHSLPYMGGPRQ